MHYNCHCYNCGNPNGPRPIPTHIKKRVNRKHELQIDIPNSKQFASDRNETFAKGVGQILRVFLMKLVGFHIWNVWKALPNYLMIERIILLRYIAHYRRSFSLEEFQRNFLQKGTH